MGRTAIPAEQDGEELAASPRRAAAAIAVTLIATGLVVLPVLAALGVWSDSFGRLATGFAGLVAVVGGVKLAGAAWGAVAAVD